MPNLAMNIFVYIVLQIVLASGFALAKTEGEKGAIC